MKKSIKISIFTIIMLISGVLEGQEITQKYQAYRNRLLDEFVVVSPEVEQFGMNIPAVDRRHFIKNDSIFHLKWSDGNSNFNHWLGLLSTEYRLLKNNNQDYTETLNMLVYALLAIERLDLYSEYCLRIQEGSTKIVDGDTVPDHGIYPEDINGFMIRDDVSLGFWKKNHSHFGLDYGVPNKVMGGTNSYLSIFIYGVIAKEGMSQDNIVRMLQALSLVKVMMDTEPMNKVAVKFMNPIIPNYLKEKNIFCNDSIYFDRWAADIAIRLVKQCQHPEPEPEMAFRFWKMKGQPSTKDFAAFKKSRWYIMNPVKETPVAEGSGSDMGVWFNAFGFAEAGNAIIGADSLHFDGSEKGFTRWFFRGMLRKNARLFPGIGIPIPRTMDDYMFRDLASVSDVSIAKNKPYLLYKKMSDHRRKYPYEHVPLVLYQVHKEKYQKMYEEQPELYAAEKQYYLDLLLAAPKKGPHNDTSRADYSPLWSSSSRLIWPGKRVCNSSFYFEYAGMDYMFLHNLYLLTFDSAKFSLPMKRANYVGSRRQKEKVNTAHLDNERFFFQPPLTKAKDKQVILQQIKKRSQLLELPSISFDTIKVDKFIQLIPLRDSIYVHRTWDSLPSYGWFTSNGMIIIKNGKAVMIDTPMDDEKTAKLLAYLKDSMGVEVEKLIIGHFHDDCMGGIKTIHQNGIESIACQKTFENCKLHQLTLPKMVFNQNYYIDFYGLQLNCKWVGAGHTNDNIVVHLPSKNILFGGCLVKSSESRSLGNLTDASLDDWGPTIQQLIQFYPKVEYIVPGHGSYGGKELLYHTLDLLEKR